MDRLTQPGGSLEDVGVSDDDDYTQANPGEVQMLLSTQKQAACLECRRSKVKCSRVNLTKGCQKCEKAGLKCITPKYRIGRHKGTKKYAIMASSDVQD